MKLKVFFFVTGETEVATFTVGSLYGLFVYNVFQAFMISTSVCVIYFMVKIN